jgi:hypothetical protein
MDAARRVDGKGIDPLLGRAGRRRRLERHVPAAPRSTLSAGVREIDLLPYAAAKAVTEGGVAMQNVTIRKRLDGGYTVGLTGQGQL